MNKLQRPIISNLNANLHTQQQQQQNSTCIVILPQTNRGNYILLRDANGNCTLPKITLPNNSEIDLHREIENFLLTRCGHGYELLKTDPKFQVAQVISPVVDFDFTHGNLNITHYVYHAQSLDQTVSLNDLDLANGGKNSKTLHFMSIVDMEKELNDPQIIRDVVTRYTLSFLVSQKIKESFDIKLGTTRIMFATAGILVSIVVGFIAGQF
ncbi:predicted protein [Naegleria gruberi]|uniref:Predicted protein n=1 Tax=Naegleria gruberi TaxID=5762 RepID=D2VJI7_NAEGR|nr:uncharacterized protein NAEGRDRAFT_69053 [Naegleria gruberi]EFC42951.1 predicted protein [Naegleria gruberi]|eukprot:XP_002675695.1 predicted protein [Naegleria gruberi strain NEG-M]